MILRNRVIRDNQIVSANIRLSGDILGDLKKIIRGCRKYSVIVSDVGYGFTQIIPSSISFSGEEIFK